MGYLAGCVIYNVKPVSCLKTSRLDVLRPPNQVSPLCASRFALSIDAPAQTAHTYMTNQIVIDCARCPIRPFPVPFPVDSSLALPLSCL